MRILIGAQNASTKFGGESLLPLNYFRILRSRQLEKWLVAHARTQAELTELFPQERDRMHFVPDTWLHRLLNNCGRFISERVNDYSFGLLTHLYTQVLQRRIVRRLLSEQLIDVVHEPTPISATVPSLMFGLGVPIVIGPMNTSVKFPLAFRSRQNPTIDVFLAIAHECVDFFHRLFAGKIKAETLLRAKDRTKQALASEVQGKIIELVENGVDFSVWRSDSSLSRAATRQVHFIFLGRLIDWKAVDAAGSLRRRRRSNRCSLGNYRRWRSPRGTRSSNSSFRHRQQRCI
ncbi:hypothetical protein QUA27_24755 [Microcoleus sp. Pol14C6]|uniref:hypothetical protein n=1 Tax=unclassified Microcoleus TaxID=2642155 RepID=UPI002FCE9EE9